MDEDLENIIRIASEEFTKLIPAEKAAGLEVEEVEKASSGNFFVTLGYWARDSKPSGGMDSLNAAFLNPWRRKYKRVEVDPEEGKAISIKMYEPPLGVS
ncbi:MAG: hypothetical protein MUF86_04930 [Akkermansiaceae bacterium]|jgi:hypothetical protein|nr:hypothetical protein [Akkermansiaceae bacterium]